MPLALLGLGLGVVGTGLNLAGNAQDASAIAATRAQFAAKQAALQQQSNAIFQNSLKDSTVDKAQTQMQTGQNARTSIWNQLQNATTPIASALPASGSTTATGNAAARASSAGSVFNTMADTAQAREGSYEDWQNQQAIKNADASQRLGVINNFSQGDANLEPVELQVASQAGSKLSGWGSIVSSLGSLAGIAGASGAFGGATSAASNSANAAAKAASLGLFPDESIMSLPAIDETAPAFTNIYDTA